MNTNTTAIETIITDQNETKNVEGDVVEMMNTNLEVVVEGTLFNLSNEVMKGLALGFVDSHEADKAAYLKGITEEIAYEIGEFYLPENIVTSEELEETIENKLTKGATEVKITDKDYIQDFEDDLTERLTRVIGKEFGLITESRAMLKEEGILHTAQDILAELSISNGFKSRDNKNFARIVSGMSRNINLLEILKDPSLVNAPKNQYRYFKEFLENNTLSEKLYTPTRHGVLVANADVDLMRVFDDEVVSLIDYSEVNEESYKEVSESFLSQQFAGEETLVKFTKEGALLKERLMLPMTDIIFVDLNLELPETEAEYSEGEWMKVKMREKLMREGFYYTDIDGNEAHAEFLLRSASQARVLQAIFINTDSMSAVEALKIMGNELEGYSRRDKDGNFVLDVDKMLSRPGLGATNAIGTKVIRLGNEIEMINEDTGEYRILGGTHTMRVIEDRYVNVTHGTYRAWDKEKQEFREFDAAEHPMKLMAADGALFCDEELKATLDTEFGTNTDAWLARITPFTKGLVVFVPNLRAYYGDHIVALKSAVKGDYVELFKANPDFTPELRIALFNKGLGQARGYTDMPYQFIQASSLNSNDLINILNPHLENISNALHDPDLIKKYVGLDKTEDLKKFSDELAHYMIDQSRVSTFTTYLDLFDWTFDDVQMKRYGLNVLKEKIEDWKVGNIPVEGHYRFMIQDPYAVLEAGTKYEVRDESGDLMIENRGSYHIQPNESYVLSTDKDKSILNLAVARNPMISKGEWQALRNRELPHYQQASRRGGFRNLLVMSVHDLATFAMGGADNDGDTALTVTEDIVVQKIKDNYVSPVMDISFIEKEDGEIEFVGDGCPYSVEMTGVYNMSSGYTLKQDNYRITFNEEQANSPGFYEEVHKLGIDYVIRTLKPNKIGSTTNIASIIADAVRGLAYDVAKLYANGVTEGYEVHSKLSKIKKYENWIDMLRLVQGWEIDAAKHGGAYEEVMKETLDFINNPPAELSYSAGDMGIRVWQKPDWLVKRDTPNYDNAPEYMKGNNLGSVLSKILEYVNQFERYNLDGVFEEMERNANQYSILTTLSSSINVNSDYFNDLLSIVSRVKGSYGAAVRRVHELAEIRKEEIFSTDSSPQLRNKLFEEVEEKLRGYLNDIADQARDYISELCKVHDAKLVGYAAYYITYVDRKEGASLAFPWTIAREAFIQTLAYVHTKEAQDQTNIREVAHRNFMVSVCIPDDVQEKFDRNIVIKGLSKENVFVQAQGDKYVLFINKTEVGFVFNSRNNIQNLLGHDKYHLTVNSVRAGGGTRTLNLNVSQLVKL